MNQTIVSYLNQYKVQFPKETLVAELQKSGYSQMEIAEAVSLVYAAVAPVAAAGVSTPVAQAQPATNHGSFTANYPQHLAWNTPHQSMQSAEPAQSVAQPAYVQMSNAAAVAGYGQPHYVGFWMRAAAMIIDAIILAAVGFAIGLVIGVVNLTTNSGLLSGANPILEKLFFQLIELAIFFVYHIFMVIRFQATLGKMALGMRVYADDLSRPSVGKVVGREFGKLVSMITLGIGYLMTAFTGKKQALHDMIAGTVVVYKDSIGSDALDANGQLKKVPSTVSVVIASVVLVAYFGLITIVIVLGVLSALVLTNLDSARGKARVAEFKASASSVAVACIAECDSPSGKVPIPSALKWDGGCHCNSKGELAPFTVTPTNTGTNCVASISVTGATFSGPDCK
ncbi:RDD family protein [Patescibacteria group bacterium]|nr:MAG: RDD family protein [Patescibacteria group bacterium]